MKDDSSNNKMKMQQIDNNGITSKELLRATQMLKESQEHNQTLKTIIDKQRHELKEYKQKCEKLRQEVEELKESQISQNDKIKGYLEKINVLEKTKETQLDRLDMNSKLDEECAELEQKIQIYEDKILRYSEKSKKYEERHKKQEEKFSKLLEKNSLMEEESWSIEEKLQGLKNIHNELEDKYSRLQSMCEGAEDKYAELQGLYKELDLKCKELEEKKVILEKEHYEQITHRNLMKSTEQQQEENTLLTVRGAKKDRINQLELGTTKENDKSRSESKNSHGRQLVKSIDFGNGTTTNIQEIDKFVQEKIGNTGIIQEGITPHTNKRTGLNYSQNNNNRNTSPIREQLSFTTSGAQEQSQEYYSLQQQLISLQQKHKKLQLQSENTPTRAVSLLRKSSKPNLQNNGSHQDMNNSINNTSNSHNASTNGGLLRNSRAHTPTMSGAKDKQQYQQQITNRSNITEQTDRGILFPRGRTPEMSRTPQSVYNQATNGINTNQFTPHSSNHTSYDNTHNLRNQDLNNDKPMTKTTGSTTQSSYHSTSNSKASTAVVTLNLIGNDNQQQQPSGFQTPQDIQQQLQQYKIAQDSNSTNNSVIKSRVATPTTSRNATNENIAILPQRSLSPALKTPQNSVGSQFPSKSATNTTPLYFHTQYQPMPPLSQLNFPQAAVATTTGQIQSLQPYFYETPTSCSLQNPLSQISRSPNSNQLYEGSVQKQSQNSLQSSNSNYLTQQQQQQYTTFKQTPQSFNSQQSFPSLNVISADCKISEIAALQVNSRADILVQQNNYEGANRQQLQQQQQQQQNINSGQLNNLQQQQQPPNILSSIYCSSVIKEFEVSEHVAKNEEIQVKKRSQVLHASRRDTSQGRSTPPRSNGMQGSNSTHSRNDLDDSLIPDGSNRNKSFSQTSGLQGTGSRYQPQQQYGPEPVKLIDNFIVISANQERVRQFIKQNVFNVDPEVIFCQSEQNTNEDQLAAMAKFCFPSGVDVHRFKRDNIKADLLKWFIPVKGLTSKEYFVFPIKSAESFQKTNNNSENTLKDICNPNKFTYCICLLTKDYLDFNSKSQQRMNRSDSSNNSFSKIQNSNSQNNINSSEHYFRVTSALMIITSFPFFDFYYQLLTSIANQLYSSKRAVINGSSDCSQADLLQIRRLLSEKTFGFIDQFMHPQSFIDFGSLLKFSQDAQQSCQFAIPARESCSYLEGCWGVVHPFTIINEYEFLFILISLLLEDTVVFLSKNASILSQTMMLFLSCVKPFKWPHPCVMFLTNDMIHLLDSPFPVVIGINKSYDFVAEQKLNKTHSHILFINMDEFCMSMKKKSIYESPLYHDLVKRIKPQYDAITECFKTKGTYNEASVDLLNLSIAVSLQVKNFFLELLRKLLPKQGFLTSSAKELDYDKIKDAVVQNSKDEVLQRLVHTQIFSYFLEENYRI